MRWSLAGLLAEAPSCEQIRKCGTKENPIAAVLVFSDPSNWYLDLQLIYDVLTSGLPPLPTLFTIFFPRSFPHVCLKCALLSTLQAIP
jgi:hypothetical protein